VANSIWIVGFWTAIILFQIVAIPALILRKNDLADVLWGPAFPICGVASVYFGGVAFSSLDARQVIVLCLATIWALRLFLHVGVRNLSHRKEDVRYNNWRKQWGSTWIWRSYLQVFVLQALILYLFLIPIFFILCQKRKPSACAEGFQLSVGHLLFPHPIDVAMR
jgi:steroid 5-alpha reductase family enzyme